MHLQKTPVIPGQKALQDLCSPEKLLLITNGPIYYAAAMRMSRPLLQIRGRGRDQHVPRLAAILRGL